VRLLPIIPTGAPQADAYPELWRLVTLRPARSRPWRDFWVVWLPSFVALMVGLGVLGIEALSPVGVLYLLVGGVVVVTLVHLLFSALGVVGPKRAARDDDLV